MSTLLRPHLLWSLLWILCSLLYVCVNFGECLCNMILQNLACGWRNIHLATVANFETPQHPKFAAILQNGHPDSWKSTTWSLSKDFNWTKEAHVHLCTGLFLHTGPYQSMYYCLERTSRVCYYIKRWQKVSENTIRISTSMDKMDPRQMQQHPWKWCNFFY